MIKYSHLKLTPAPLSAALAPSLRANSIIAITKDGYGLADILAQKLNALGCQAMVVDLLPDSCDVAILLDAFQPFDTKEQAIAINEAIFAQIKQIGTQFAEKGGKLITVQDTSGHFGLTDTPECADWAAGVSGLIKTADQEWESVSCKVIDLQRADQTVERLANHVLSEIIYDDQHIEVGLLADGRRVVIEVVEAVDCRGSLRTALMGARSDNRQPQGISPTFSQQTSSFSKGGVKGGGFLQEGNVVLVTGGARGVTAACLIALAHKVKLKFVLFGRTPLSDAPDEFQDAKTEAELKPLLFAHYKEKNIKVTPKDISSHISSILSNREIRHTIEELIKAGSMVEYLPVNVLDEAELQKAVDDVRKKWGTISGVVHGAGVLADKLITQKTPEQFQKVFNTKVLGLKNLLSVTKNDVLKTLILFSSVAGRFGNPGQCDYAMANEVLNKVAQNYQRQHPSCIVKSINWGPWESGMVTAQLKKLFEERGVALIPIDVGAQIFVDEVFSNDQQVEVVVGGILKPDVLAQTSESPTTQKKTLTFFVDQKTYPFLSDHVVKDTPVLPACLALEWFVQAAKKYYPAFNAIEVKNFRVLRGIQLTKFYEMAEAFVVTCSEDPSNKNVLKLTLTKNDSPAPNYMADVILGESLQCLTNPQDIQTSELQSWSYKMDEIYNGDTDEHILFHGKAFQSICHLDKVSDNLATATIEGTKSMSWPGQWDTDALAVDTIFQLGIVWGKRMLGKHSLPAAFSDFRMSGQPMPSGKLQCTLFNCQTKGDRIIYDALLQSEDGQAYAEFKEVQGVCYDI